MEVSVCLIIRGVKYFSGVACPGPVPIGKPSASLLFRGDAISLSV